MARRKFTTLLLGLFGGLALALASVGIYGVVSYGVAQRTREIGIRTALGAGPREVLRLVFDQALRLAGVGLLVGAAAAFVLTRFMQSLLFQTPPFDPSTFAGVGVLLTGIVLLALRESRAPRPAREPNDRPEVGVRKPDMQKGEVTA